MTRPAVVLSGLFAVTAIALAVVWVIRESDPGRFESIDPRDRELVALGREVYDRECAACHGRDLEGQPDWRIRRPDGLLPAPPHDETGHTWHHPDEQLFLITRDGIEPFAPPGYVSDMPAFGDRLNDDEIRAAIAYIKSRWSPDTLAYQEDINRRAEEATR